MLTARQATRTQIADVAAFIKLILPEVFTPEDSIKPLGFDHNQPNPVK
jgi:hypothetical protein